MTVEDLIPGLNIEDTHNEFKGIIEEGKGAASGRGREIGWLKTVAAFANTDGGSLYVGVEDKTHKLLALDHDAADKIVLMIHRQIKQRLEPAVPYRIEALPLKKDGRTRYVRHRQERLFLLPGPVRYGRNRQRRGTPQLFHDRKPDRGEPVQGQA